MPIDFPNDFFDPPTERPANWPDDPDLRRAVGWLKSIMTETEWKQRRDAAANRLYDAALQRLDDPSGKGRFFAESDTFGWYLFLGDAFLDHIGNYEPMFGSRVVPILQAIGLDRLKIGAIIVVKADPQGNCISKEREEFDEIILIPGGFFEFSA
jgi:hypothetical protein